MAGPGKSRFASAMRPVIIVLGGGNLIISGETDVRWEVSLL